MKSSVVALSLLTSLLAAVAAFAAPGELAIVAPPDKSSLESRTVSIVVRVGPDSPGDLLLAVNGRKQQLPRKSAARYFLCFDGISLSPGVNRIRVVALKEGKKTAEGSLTIFVRSDLDPTADTPPAGFTPYAFHNEAHEKACTPCHRLDFKGMEETPAAPEKSPCYACHKRLLASSPFLHGPAAVWSCGMCHGAKPGNGSALAADDAVCTSCHDDSLARWKSMRHMHGPTAAGRCTTCHNPHAADRQYFLRLPATDLCLSCHEEIAAKPHVISGFSGKGHPFRISPDPFRPGRDFTCASCHNPHASDSPVFLNFVKGAPEGLTSFCKSCHVF